jgi:hypothetical protein
VPFTVRADFKAPGRGKKIRLHGNAQVRRKVHNAGIRRNNKIAPGKNLRQIDKIRSAAGIVDFLQRRGAKVSRKLVGEWPLGVTTENDYFRPTPGGKNGFKNRCEHLRGE